MELVQTTGNCTIWMQLYLKMVEYNRNARFVKATYNMHAATSKPQRSGV